MRFLVMVKATKDSEAGVMPSEKLLADMGKFNEELVKAGIMLAAEGLHASSKGARVQFSGSKRTVVDGPFTETKELVAGFWLWQVKSKEEAIEWVKRCPNPMPGDSEIEIRQIIGMGGLRPRGSPPSVQKMKRSCARSSKSSRGVDDIDASHCAGQWRRRTARRASRPSEKPLADMGKFNEELVKAGVMLAAEGLQASSKGVARPASPGASATVVDGPFTETKELVAGFWLWQVKSKEEAIEWVKRCPNPDAGGLRDRDPAGHRDRRTGRELTPELQKMKDRREKFAKQAKS